MRHHRPHPMVSAAVAALLLSALPECRNAWSLTGADPSAGHDSAIAANDHWAPAASEIVTLHSEASRPRATLADLRREDATRLAKQKVPRPAVPTEKVNAHGMARGMKPPEELRLNLEGRDIVTIYSTGSVRLGEGLSVDQAARDFWRKVGELAPTFCHPPPAK
jgi:hypothetical protein